MAHVHDISDDTINKIKATAAITAASVIAVPLYHKFIKPKFTVVVDTKKDDDAGVS